jgi:CRISPR/Cas system-associated exonuclease Cas4 (RecB family)
MEELIVIKDLINAGCEVKGINIDKSIAETFKLLFNIDLKEHKQKEATFSNGHGGASCDGIIYNLPDAPKTPHLLEVKTSNTKKFENLRLNKVKKAFPVHYIQMQIYMHLFKLRRALYISVCKENDQRHYERVNYEKDVAINYIERATNIISSERAPERISNDETFFICRWCDYSDICHKGFNPTLNCRTCDNVGMRDNGVWVCELKGSAINLKRQKKGCKNYQLSKGFI